MELIRTKFLLNARFLIDLGGQKKTIFTKRIKNSICIKKTFFLSSIYVSGRTMRFVRFFLTIQFFYTVHCLHIQSIRF